MNAPLNIAQAKHANADVKKMLMAMIVVIMGLGLLLFYAISQETDAVSVLKKSADHSDCRSDISTDTYQRYWKDVAQALQGAQLRDAHEFSTATKDMLAIPLIKQVVAQRCPPPIGNQEVSTP